MLSSFIIVVGVLLVYTLLTRLVMFIFAIDDFIKVFLFLILFSVTLFGLTLIVSVVRGVI